MNAVHTNPLAALGLGAIRPDYAMTPAQYGERVIPVAVYPVMDSGRICLAAADDAADQALERVRSLLEQHAPSTAQDRASWAVLKVREMLERVNAVPEFEKDDVWVGNLGEHPILVVKKGTLDLKQLSLEDAVRRVHRSLVAEAMRKGLPVPAEVAREHQLDVDHGAERDLP